MTIDNCIKCDLCITRRQIVNGKGNSKAKIMFIGEAPGLTEDKKGEPLVGKAGLELNKYLWLCGFNRDDIYITEAIKCRPPGNRVPTSSEISNCKDYLLQEIEDVNPKIIVLLGTVALFSIIGEYEQLLKFRGKAFPYNGRVMFFTYHPSYPMRNTDKRILYFNHFKSIVEMYRFINPIHTVNY